MKKSELRQLIREEIEKLQMKPLHENITAKLTGALEGSDKEGYKFIIDKFQKIATLLKKEGLYDAATVRFVGDLAYPRGRTIEVAVVTNDQDFIDSFEGKGLHAEWLPVEGETFLDVVRTKSKKPGVSIDDVLNILKQKINKINAGDKNYMTNLTHIKPFKGKITQMASQLVSLNNEIEQNGPLSEEIQDAIDSLMELINNL